MFFFVITTTQKIYEKLVLENKNNYLLYAIKKLYSLIFENSYSENSYSFNGSEVFHVTSFNVKTFEYLINFF